jgi:leucyl-tRNA synthetase
MEFNNALIKQQREPVAQSAAYQEALATLLQLLAPFAPHITEELWQQSDHTGSIHTTEWPAYIEELTQDEAFTLVVQVNGKVRERMEVPADISEEEVRKLALANERVQSFIGSASIQKIIYIPGRLVNIVVRKA